MAKRVTMKDIAVATGVSVATVSYILHNTPGKYISDDTRQRVLAASQQLRYIPNTSAQRLRTNRSNCIAVRLSHTLTMPRYHNMLQGIRSCLNESGYSLLLASHDARGSFAGSMEACMSGQADGLIYIAAEGIGIPDEELQRLRDWGIPVSVIDCMGSNPDVSSVVYDYYASSRIRMDCFLQRGFRKFLYIRPSYQNYKESARELGVRSILMEREDVCVDVYHMKCLSENWPVLNKRQSILTSKELMDEVRGNLDQLPRDVAVICYAREVQEVVSRLLFADSLRNPTPEASQWHYRSLSYHFPHFDAGVEAARSLLSELNGEKNVRKLSLQPILEYTNPELF